ncbi:hypothetical protein [Agriterribacter sp.]|uniref:hypothetical protein n=1 Tax=Agriterribacter sp. TaxID=2821509 RepID=UPI002CC55CB7|nr:hypothetical protein [Agriterribacter sp.]HRO46632.1 hypothetical protein [Agriterribacter sp.]HRQ17292.1 hypothetical protein [Agriterribacter sp.]
MSAVIHSKRYINVLWACLLMVAVLNFGVITLYHNGLLGTGIGRKLYNLLYVDRESNLPSFFNTVLLLIAAALLFITFLLHKQRGNVKIKNYWLLLSLIFLFLSADESISIHEYLTVILPQLGIGGSGFLTFAWILPYALVTLLVGLYFMRFLLSLQKPVRTGFILSGIVYLCGVIGFEMIGGSIAEKQGLNNITFALVASCEEIFEMAGIILFIHYIMKYIRLEFEQASITIAP